MKTPPVLLVFFLFAEGAFALEPEARSLLPEGGRSPVEAGLESGRYRELTPEEWKSKSREPAATPKGDSKARSDDPDFSEAQ